jgi:SAM-dependent methyltransferase
MWRDGEQFVPHANAGPRTGWDARARFWVRQVIDLQVGTVVRDCRPWLARQAGTLLDVGCGDQPYRHFLNRSCAYVGLELAGVEKAFGTGNVDSVAHYSGGIFPFSDGAFDSVFHTETLEHVVDPEGFLRECARVLRPGGEMCFSVPFQARFHYIPHDYWRFTPTALEMLMVRAGFEDVRIDARGTDAAVACTKVLGVCYRIGRARPVLLPVLGPVIACALALAHLSLRFGWGSPDDCLGYTVTARREVAVE